MEEICHRMPHILEQVNEFLDFKSLIKCKKVSRMMCSIIEQQKSGKILAEKVIQSYIKNPKEFGKDWKMVFQKSSLERLKELAILVKCFYKAVPSRLDTNWSAMHIAAERGHLDFCKFISKFSTIKSYEWPPLNFSAQEGHLEVSEFLFKEFEGNKDRRIFGIAQHLAAKNGHLEIYKFLHESSKEINPLMKKGITPLHLAAQYGHFEVCNYICDNAAFVGPRRSDKNTPLSLAIHRGHIKIARLLHERDDSPWDRDSLLLYQIYFMSLCFFTVFDIFFLYPSFGKSFIFHETMKSINFIMFKCPPFPLAFIAKNILKDILFCFGTSPKLDF